MLSSDLLRETDAGSALLRLVLAYDLLVDRRTIDVIINHSFILIWRKDLRIEIIFYVTGRKKISKEVL